MRLLERLGLTTMGQLEAALDNVSSEYQRIIQKIEVRHATEIHKAKEETKTEEKKFDRAKCAFCGFKGIYGVDIIDQDYFDGAHDTTTLSCRDLEACFKRGGRTRAIY